MPQEIDVQSLVPNGLVLQEQHDSQDESKVKTIAGRALVFGTSGRPHDNRFAISYLVVEKSPFAVAKDDVEY